MASEQREETDNVDGIDFTICDHRSCRGERGLFRLKMVEQITSMENNMKERSTKNIELTEAEIKEAILSWLRASQDQSVPQNANVLVTSGDREKPAAFVSWDF